jgi:hypothetical protein
MRIAVRVKHQPTAASWPRVMEVVAPRTNTATLTSAENFFASVAPAEPVAVEIAADSTCRRFLVRAGSDRVRQQLVSQLGAAYPQAEVRLLAASDDPATPREGEQVAACALGLRAPAYLPLRTFTDLDVDGQRAAQADPVLGILSTLGDLPPGWRALSQIVLLAAPENWCRAYQRYSVQHPLEPERVRGNNETAVPTLAFLIMLLLILLASQQAYSLFRVGLWLQLCALILAAFGGVAVAVLLFRYVNRTKLYDMDLVREKVTRIACRAEVHLLVFGPTDAPRAALERQLDRLAAAYRRFNLAAANGFVPRRVRAHRVRAEIPRSWQSPGRMPVLTTLELAGVWHLPHAAADVPLLERTTARRWLPLPTSVSGGCRIGMSRHQGREVPVALPSDLLRRHLLLVAKTRRGKSTLMQRLALHVMQVEPRRAVLLVDPHCDLAVAMLGLVPRERSADVVFLDVADRTRPFGLNLLDVALGWDRDRAVSNAVTIFQREWGDRHWGPRMEDAFRFALMTLFEANMALVRLDPGSGRAAQHTLLDIPALFSEIAFRRDVLASISDPTIRTWWAGYFDRLEHRLQLEVINPVLTKVHRFQATTEARNIAGQSASTVDPLAWVREGAIVIVNTARGIVGENAAALIGSTLLNLATLGIAEQARLPSGRRRAITIFVDEFHTIPGADYESMLSELSKYGANLVLATQSLARLLTPPGEQGRGLRATVFANLDGLFAFNCSAEDAEYVVPELGGAIDEQDLIELGEHQCYVRISSLGKRLPTFWVQLDPPLVGDPEHAVALAQASGERYGRVAVQLEAARAEGVRARQLEAYPEQAADPSPKPATQPSQRQPRARNEHRPRKKRPQPRVANA